MIYLGAITSFEVVHPASTALRRPTHAGLIPSPPLAGIGHRCGRALASLLTTASHTRTARRLAEVARGRSH